MIWQNPIAWLGLAALAVPVLVHLLARRTTRRVRFPTLRFIDPSRLTPARRRQLTDIPLLLIRAAVIAAAVAALAGPWVMTRARADAADARLARAVVIDAGAVMAEPGPDGRTGLDAARDAAADLGEAADTERVMESRHPGMALRGAAAWLEAQGGRRELVVLSAFRGDWLDAEVIAALDDTIGLRLLSVEVDPAASATLSYRLGETAVTTSVSPGDLDTTADWLTAPAADADASPLLLIGSESETAALQHLAAGVRRLSEMLPGNIFGGMAVIPPNSEEFEQLAAGARAIDVPWMADVVAALRRDPAVSGAAADVPTAPDTPAMPSAATPVARAASGAPIVSAGVARIDQEDRLAIFLATDAASPVTAAVLAGLPVPVDAAPFEHLETRQHDPATLEAWTRPATPVALAADRAVGSDGRWLWLLALALLLVEGVMRRASPAVASAPGAITQKEDAHARVA